MGFFSTVYYSQGLEDTSCFSYAETIADVCRAPSRWIASELFEGGKTYMILTFNETGVEVLASKIETEGWRKVLRVIVGLVLSIPGTIMAIPFMAFAYASEEIRLKHRSVISNELTVEELKKLKELIDERQKLAKERQGCEPVSCILFSICCLLCCMVCCRGN